MITIRKIGDGVFGLAVVFAGVAMIVAALRGDAPAEPTTEEQSSVPRPFTPGGFAAPTAAGAVGDDVDGSPEVH